MESSTNRDRDRDVKLRVGMISLGCPKNQVDAEVMLADLKKNGFEIKSSIDKCDVIIVNTCGFIESAKQESIDTILECCELKKGKESSAAEGNEGKVKLIVVTGCLAERYKEEIVKEIPEVDVVVGIGGNKDIVNLIKEGLMGKKVMNFPAKEEMKISGERVLTTKSYLAYLKIAEGCNNRCTYCAISLIRGDYRSRPVEEILAEAKELAALGVKELNIVAQDTTLYGIDIYGKIELPRLLKDLCKIDGIEWIRLLYSYPDKITDELIDVIASEPKIVKYMDIPLQHVDGTVLKRMNRPGDMNTIEDLLNKLRSRVPGIVIRTTFIVGFPGETEEQFNNLCKFVSKQKFERLGCFTYSPEEDTPAAEYPDQIDQAVKNRRQELIMDCQLRIINEFNDSKVGEKLRVLVEGYDKEYEVYYGRSYMDAPEVDCNIFFKVDNGQEIKEGDFVEVIVEGADGYDLVGKLIEGKEISKEGER